MKKIIIIFLITIFIYYPANVLAFNDTAKSSVAVDINSGRVLYSKNKDDKRLIASITKIMTAIVSIENTKLTKVVEVGNEVLKMYGTNIYVEVGEKITINDLLYGLLLRSGNDAAEVLANNVFKDEKEFINQMNKKANKIGMKNTTFNNPHGLDDNTKNYSTAYDMALLSCYASKNKTYRKIVKTTKYETSTKNKTYLWYNRNKILSLYKYSTGGKNGYTPDAGKTLVTTAEKSNLNITIVTLNDSNSYQNHINIYEDIYNKYKNYMIIDKNNFKISKNFYGGNPYVKRSFVYPLTEQEINQIKTIVNITNTKSKKIGYITIYLKNDIIGTVDIFRK